jgi:hypothetical protein
MWGDSCLRRRRDFDRLPQLRQINQPVQEGGITMVAEGAVTIYFDDLKEEAQDRVLKAYNLERPKDANWDIFPLMELPVFNFEE